MNRILGFRWSLYSHFKEGGGMIDETPIPFDAVPYPSEFKILGGKVIRNITYGEI